MKIVFEAFKTYLYHNFNKETANFNFDLYYILEDYNYWGKPVKITEDMSKEQIVSLMKAWATSPERS